jgi:hypothetical protein
LLDALPAALFDAVRCEPLRRVTAVVAAPPDDAESSEAEDGDELEGTAAGASDVGAVDELTVVVSVELGVLVDVSVDVDVVVLVDVDGLVGLEVELDVFVEVLVDVGDTFDDEAGAVEWRCEAGLDDEVVGL